MVANPSFATCLDRQARLPDLNLDSSAEHEVLANDRGLTDLALGEEDARLAVPAHAVAEKPRRRCGGPAGDPAALGRLRRVMGLLRRVLSRAEGVVEPASRQEAGADHALCGITAFGSTHCAELVQPGV